MPIRHQPYVIKGGVLHDGGNELVTQFTVQKPGPQYIVVGGFPASLAALVIELLICLFVNNFI